MRNKFLLFFLTLLFFLPSAFAGNDQNLILNGDFSQVTENGLPAEWSTYAYFTDSGVTHFSCDGETAEIYNLDRNDARFCQTVAVDPNSYYQITCRVKVDDASLSGEGANISIDNTFTHSNTIRESDGEWMNLTLCGLTGTDQTEVNVLLRLGFYGAENSGRVWFDDVSMVKLDSAPADISVQSFATIAPSGSTNNEETSANYETQNELILLLTVLVLCGMFAVYKQMKWQRPELTASSARSFLWIALICALVVRCIIAVSLRGFYWDINCFEAWSYRIFHTGVFDFYSADYFCDYPPVYMLLLWPAEALRSLFGIGYDSAAHWLLVKAIPVLCDLGGAVVLFRFARKHAGERIALMLAMLYAFNPVAVIDSAAWGQVDSVFTLMLVVAVTLLVEKRFSAALPIYALAVLTKPQSLLFAPIGLCAIVILIMRAEKSDRKNLLKTCGIGIGAAFAVLVLIAAFFSGGTNPITWLWNLYSGTVSGYKYVTINAMNVYELFSLNWTPVSSAETVTIVASVCMALSYLYAFFLAIRSKKSHHLYLAAACFISLLFAFGPMMHERYAFPAILLLLFAFAVCKDKRILYILAVFTAGQFINITLILQDGLHEVSRIIGGSDRFYTCTAAVVNVLSAAALARVSYDIIVRERIITFETSPLHEVKIDAAPDYKLNLKRGEYLAMAVVTLTYSVLAFTNLGSKAPETAWIASKPGESVVFDLGEEQTFHMTYYGGICYSSFTVELSSDGETWSEPHSALYNQGECFRWLWYQPGEYDSSGQFTALQSGYPMQTARYVRLRAQRVGLTLHEVSFLDENSNPITIASISRSGSAPEFETDYTLLIDEQDTVPPYPSYYNGTYFDEIYHARTAYEHDQGLTAYEYTHPPLGKVLIMVGIRIFGMNPFGWRFMGALMGVLMLPAMYMLVRQLTKRADLSLIAMLLMALDSMHFTQTRIATIDSYVVFFIMMMYIFMIRYMQMSYLREKLWKTLIPLGLSGLFMAFAWASKWTGIYASIGLALLFFITIWQRSKEYLANRESIQSKCFWHNTVITLACCLVFFIAVPAVVYYFSYYWHMLPQGGLSVKGVLQIQENMFRYHADLEATHGFQSPWYEWPLIVRPMWYYSGTSFMPAGVISSISCMGNPAVWWSGIVAMVTVVFLLAAEKHTDKDMLTVAIGFASQYMPWVLISRCTFIYHYFTSVPFIIMAIVLVLNRFMKLNARIARRAGIMLVCVAAVLFVMFYPLESGMPVARAYAQLLRWFNWYNF